MLWVAEVSRRSQKGWALTVTVNNHDIGRRRKKLYIMSTNDCPGLVMVSKGREGVSLTISGPGPSFFILKLKQGIGHEGDNVL